MADPAKSEPVIAAPAALPAALPAATPAPAAVVAPAEPSSAAALPAVDLAKPAGDPAPGVHETPTLLETVGEPADVKPSNRPADKPADEKAAPTAKPEDKKTEAKPGEVKPAEAKPADAKPAEPVKPAPVEYKYTLPETIRIDDKIKGELHTALDEFRANPTEGAQKLLDLHAKTLTDFVQVQEKKQREVFAETNKNWHKEILADPELGGSGYQTTSAAVARMRDLMVSPADMAPRQWDDGSPRMSAFQEMCRVTGVGNHPVFWRMLHNVAKWLDEPQHGDQPTDIKPPADLGRNPARRGREVLYDHPRSQSRDS